MTSRNAYSNPSWHGLPARGFQFHYTRGATGRFSFPLCVLRDSAVNPFVIRHSPTVYCLLSTLFFFLPGCTVGPTYTPPQTVLPDTWSNLHPTTQPTTLPTTQPLTLTQWWTAFQDPTLDALITRAAQSNPDLKIATARIREARALRRITGADAGPTVNANASYSRSRISENAGFAGVFEGGAGGGSGGGAGGIPPGLEGVGGVESGQDLWQTGLDASWELDIFGGTRRSIEASQADVEAAIENRRDVLVSLLAEVARNYVELRGLQQQLRIAQANLKSQQDTLDLTQARFDAGLTGELDVARARALVSTTAAQIPTLQSLTAQTIHRLSVLIAQEPAALVKDLADPRPIPGTPPIIPIGLPSDLLRRRADIRRAERDLAAATARIGAATADLFPRFALTGNVGLQSDRLGNLGSWDSRFWNFGPSLSLPLFDRGRIRANIQIQDARQEQALAQYEKAVLTALQEVEDALVAYAHNQLRRQSLADAVQANRRAVELANELYTKGLTDFLTVLEAQRSLLLTEDQLVQSERAVSTDLVLLYKALGGGWESEQPPQ